MSTVVQAPSREHVLTDTGHEQAIRWRDGERLDKLFEDRCDRLREAGRGDQLAVDAGDVALTYDELDSRANQLARHLRSRGIRPGDRVALLFDRAVHSYVGMLAVLKINAAYVPLDAGFPADRLAYIVRDAGVRAVLSLSHLRDHLRDVSATAVWVDEAAALVAAEDDHRLTDAERGEPVEELCYIIYTSGSTGRPKGVAIEHASICNFVRVAAEVYGVEAGDRVYQGMTIAFDFAVEEIWVPWMAGATLVPKPGGSCLLGADLREFLQANRVTALCCVPTLLATLDEDLPDLRFLLVSGEACPRDLITRWYRPDRRFLNVYGPTEATVTATWTAVHPDRAVTIGVPLPTYSVVILEPGEDRALPHGELGEIGIAGIGLASGYLNRADLTDRVFIRDFLEIGNNPSGRIYRTGDLGRVNDDGEIEYHGRIDTQVKIRGYRIELTEIESVLLQVPGIAQAVVTTYEPEPGVVELAAYFTLRKDTESLDRDLVYEHLRQRLPGYMVPAYLEHLAAIPMLPCDKADRKSLPAPTNRRAGRSAQVVPATDAERILADALAGVMRLDQVSVESHFFDDLGANSLLMAQFCARVRKQAVLPPVAMQDVYLHPTVRSLAAALAALPVASASLAPVPDGEAAPAHPPQRAAVGTPRHFLCGTLQLLAFLAFAYINAVILVEGLRWIIGGNGWLETHLRASAFGAGSFVYLCAAPVLAKWIIIGRWRPEEIRIWSLPYLRFWAVKALIRSSPLVMFVGSPLYLWYLRALGARIGRGVAIFSTSVPVCTDLLTVGDGAVIYKASSFTCYRAHAGLIQTGPVSVGADVYVGGNTVLDIHTSLGDGAQLGHASSLHAGQSVPDGERWHGSPARRADVDYRAVEPTKCGNLRRVLYCAAQLLNVFLSLPLGIGVLSWLIEHLMSAENLTLSGWRFYSNVVVISLALYLIPMLTGLVFVVTVPRVLNLALKPDRVYPLYGLHYAIQRAVSGMTNAKFYINLLGDSSYIVHYLRVLGYDLGRVVQTGSNFGTELGHESPYLSSIGSGTMVSDALYVMNADFSSTSFRVSQVSVGERNFLGNNILFPAAAKTGENCLLATKVMIPIDGPVRENVGLLGSPCFEIPRSVERDTSFDHLKSGDELRRRLAGKNRYNAATIGLYLFVQWIRFLGVAVIGLATVPHLNRFGALAVAVAGLVIMLFSIAYSIFIERLTGGFRPLTPRFCSIYDRYFWWHERLWKMLTSAMFSGTPFKPMMWRLLGVRIGRRVFDDGCGMPEKTLVTIGDDCTLNAGSVIQCHSLEDGAFKSDYITIGAGCTLGVESFVHYGVTMGDGSVLDADSFLMKGAEVAPNARWRGNPAREISMIEASPKSSLQLGGRPDH